MKKRNKNKNSNKKTVKRAKVLVPVFLSFTLGTVLVGCTANDTGGQPVDQIEFTISPEVSNPELIMNNLPTASHWFPAELLEWTPSSDKNLTLNQSTVKLAERVGKDKLDTVNQTQIRYC